MFLGIRLSSLAIALILNFALLNQLASAQTWSERLGYPVDRPVVILDAREMGVAWEMNHAGQKLLTDGLVQSVELVPTGPRFQHFADWCSKQERVDIGICFALTTPYSQYRWRFISPRNEIVSLVDADGYPRHTMMQFALNADAQEVEKELHAQIQAARNTGLKITHMTALHGVVYSRTDLAAAYFAVSRKYWIPAVVVELTDEHIERFRKNGFPLDDEMVHLIRNYPLPKLDDLRTLPVAATLEGKREQLIEMIDELPAGLVQIMLHPAVHSPGLEELDPEWQQRIWDGELMADPKIEEAFKNRGVVFTNWSEIMDRFEGKVEISDTAPPDNQVQSGNNAEGE